MAENEELELTSQNRTEVIGNHIASSFEKATKGSGAPVGTVHYRHGKAWVKTANGYWIPKSSYVKGAPPDLDTSHKKHPLYAQTNKEVQKIVDSEMPKSKKVVAMMHLGVMDKGKLAALSGAHYSQVYSIFKAHHDDIELKGKDVPEDAGKAKGDTAHSSDAAEPVLEMPKLPTLPEVDMKQRWASYEMFINMVLTGGRKAAFAYGLGGVGKSFILNKILKESTPNRPKLREFDEEYNKPGQADYDYVTIKGKATPVGLYKALWEHNKKLIVFDDCDKVFKDDDAINMLKGALDSTGDGTISYASARNIVDDDGLPIPKRFKFTGRVIFVSNVAREDFPQPLRSRALTVDLTMTPDQAIERLEEITPKMTFKTPEGTELHMSQDDLKAGISFLKKYKDAIDVSSLDARTLGSIALVKQEADRQGMKDWEKAAVLLLTPQQYE